MTKAPHPPLCPGGFLLLADSETDPAWLIKGWPPGATATSASWAACPRDPACLLLSGETEAGVLIPGPKKNEEERLRFRKQNENEEKKNKNKIKSNQTRKGVKLSEDSLPVNSAAGQLSGSELEEITLVMKR